MATRYPRIRKPRNLLTDHFLICAGKLLTISLVRDLYS